ncbi:pentapeptide repeat-containing protein [Acetobacterium woodii]|uniref:Uncharacterized protein n=1 Tax=Acetobacterium woodii (strain ATCC 29683 / DSM 1030 / JCM 2381 / KCTC 1655 / WB1) TaxID=931626 RepID=H6LCL1_ACEWD|nr:pentapeptide repeat-containing protein [Acetobacterium woodii]AFA47793.1 hypothetical protein containing pentapeptide repeat [Acetobacterium woodii DSM 1030]
MENNDGLEIFPYFKDCVIDKKSQEWNSFRKKNRKLAINFDHCDLSKLELTGFNLKGISFIEANFSESIFINCILDFCQLEKVQAFGASFNECSLVQSPLLQGNYVTCNFISCDLRYADFSNSRIHQSSMKHCKSDNAIYKSVSFYDTCLYGSSFSYSDFSGSSIKKVQLQQADFTAISVDGATIFWDCYYDKKTNFTGVGLDSCRIEPVLLSSFHCNIRRIWWEKWYHDKKINIVAYFKLFKQNPLLHFLDLFKGIGTYIIDLIVKFFWWITDYGSSTIRLLIVFLATTLIYATLYAFGPHLTNDLILNTSTNHLLIFIRSLYFSVIVMTGLGFGEINAFPYSYLGHIVILLESLMGYILLGAFLVRIGILFQGEFPVAPARETSDCNCNPEQNAHVTNPKDHI